MNKLPALIFAAAAALLAGCAAAIDPTDAQAIYDAAYAEYEKAPRHHAKRFILAQTTSTEGEGDIGRYSYTRQTKHQNGETMTYYVSTAECDSDKCRGWQPYAEQIAGDFIAEYNALVGREVLRLGKDGGGDVPIYLRDTPKYITEEGRRKKIGWNCPEDNYIDTMDACAIYVWWHDEEAVKVKSDMKSRQVSRKILATLGLYGTRNAVFGICATYFDPKYDKPGHGISYGGKLCQQDYFGIVFIDRHVKPGMKADEIAQLYEEHADALIDELVAKGLGK